MILARDAASDGRFRQEASGSLAPRLPRAAARITRRAGALVHQAAAVVRRAGVVARRAGAAAGRATRALAHRAARSVSLDRPAARAWLGGLLLALAVAVPVHFTFASEPALAALPVDALHRLGLTPWSARPYDDIRQIPFHVVEVETDELPLGQREPDREGRPGLVRVRGLLFEAPGRREDRVIARTVLRPPQDGRVRVGTGHYVVVNGHHYEFTKVLHLTATAYDYTWQSNGPWTGQPTELGVPLGPGIAAVDPDVIPLGTWLYVTGYGLALAADTGSAIQGDRIDLFFDLSPEEVRAFGIRPVTVYELDLPPVPPVGPGAKP